MKYDKKLFVQLCQERTLLPKTFEAVFYMEGNPVFEKLLSMSEPWLQYAIRLNLRGESREDLIDLKKEVLKDKKIQSYLTDFLSKYDFVKTDSRFCEMIDLISGRQ